MQKVIRSACRILCVGVMAMFGASGMMDSPSDRPDIYYVCVLSSSDMPSLAGTFRTFAKTHGMSFQARRLNPEGTALAIELSGLETRIFMTNDVKSKELYVTIEPVGSTEQYRSNAETLNRNILEQLENLRPLVVEWRRLPANYSPTVPAATHTSRGPAL